jgi:ABC-type multidrug transport system fused ATPase/permease subunit
LLRLLDSQCGSIIVDGIDTSNIHKTYLRRHCYITVPQDPFILTSATLRFNLDPDETMPATTLIHALEKTGLWKHFHHFSKLGHQGLLLSDEALLDLPMSSLPPLSAGQLQLLSLSRALAHAQAVSDSTFCNLYTTPSPEKRKPIVLLDEATSAMDPDTDGLMQDVIEEEFTRKGYTVILVAHRVSNIVKGFRDGVDAVVWMAEGRIERVAHTQQDAGLGSEDGGEEGST